MISSTEITLQPSFSRDFFVPPEEYNLIFRVFNVETKGFKNVAMKLSISESAVSGGDLGWVNENKLAKKFRLDLKRIILGSGSDQIFELICNLVQFV